MKSERETAKVYTIPQLRRLRRYYRARRWLINNDAIVVAALILLPAAVALLLSIGALLRDTTPP